MARGRKRRNQESRTENAHQARKGVFRDSGDGTPAAMPALLLQSVTSPPTRQSPYAATPEPSGRLKFASGVHDPA